VVVRNDPRDHAERLTQRVIEKARSHRDRLAP
jgi:hypothetical protein